MTTIAKPSVAWITGASSGIGRALAEALADRGWTVAISARGPEGLNDVVTNAGVDGRLVPYPLDITRADDAGAVVAAIEQDLGPIDLAILNAGTHIPVSASAFDRDAVAKLIETNLIGTVNCLDALMPRFISRRGGEIAIVASMTGYRGLPTSAGYGATKAGLINMAEALRPELRLHDVSMRLINPGFIDTPLTRRNPFPMPFLVSPEKAAEIILRKLSGRAFEITVPWQMAVVMKALRFLPNAVALAITQRTTPAADNNDRPDEENGEAAPRAALR